MKAALVVLVLLCGLCSLAMAGDEEQPGKFKITTKRPDDVVAVQAGKDSTVFLIRSPFGISEAVVERTSDKWPATVVLRLRLKGLESFHASNGTTTLDAAVSAHEGQPKVRLWKDGKEDTRLDMKSPLWMDIRVLNQDGGTFEMTLPKAFFEGNPQAITLTWIDFHR